MAEENYTSQSEIEEVSPPSNDAMNDQSFINQDVSVPEVNMSPTINVTPPDKFDPDISSQFLTEGSKYGYSDPTALDWDSVIDQIDTTGFGPMVDPYAKMTIDIATELNTMAAFPLDNANNTYPGYASPHYNPAKAYDTKPDLNSQNGIESFLRGSQQSVVDDGLEVNPGQGYEAPFIGGIKRFNADRYYAMPIFQELGFNPFIDNEAVYDKNAGFWDYQARFWPQFGRQFGSAFTSSYRTWEDLFNGRVLAGDAEGAEVFTDVMRIAGSQSEGGAFTAGFWNDLSLQLAYPMGIIGNIVVEDLIIRTAARRINPALGSVGAKGSAGRKVNKLKNFFANNFAMPRAINASANFIKNMKSVDSAKKFFYAGGNALGNLLAPNTLYAIKNMNTAKNTVQGVSNIRKVMPLFGEFYKDLRMLNLALAESKLEGGIVQKEMTEQLYREYKKNNNGAEPTQEVYDRIAERSEEAAHTDALINLPIIFLTNKLVLGPASRGFRDMGDQVARSMKTTGSRVAFNKTAQDVFYDAGTGIRRVWNAGIKGSPRMLAGAALYYVGANIGEGLQELAQEATAVGVKNYYTGLYNRDMSMGLDLNKSTLTSAAKEADDLLGQSFTKAVQSQMSKEGWRTFLSGFFMAAPIQGTQKLIFEAIPNLYKSSTGDAKYKKYKEYKDNFAKERAKEASTVYNNMGEYFDKLKLNLIEQKEYDTSMYMASVAGNALEFYDKRDMSTFRHIYTVASMGKMHHFKDAVKDMLKLGDVELKQAFSKDSKNDSPAKIREKLEKRLQRMNEIEKLYREIDSKHINPYDPMRYEDGTVAANNELAAFESFEFAKMMKMFVNDVYKRAEVRRNQIYDSALADPVMSKIESNDIAILLNKKDLLDEIKLLSLETKEKAADAELEKIRKGKLTKLDLLIKYQNILYDPANQTKTGGYDKRKIGKLKSAYVAYLKHQSKTNDGVIANDKVDKSLDAIIDHQWLGYRTEIFYKSIEVLENPTKIFEFAKRFKDVMIDQYESHKTGVEQLRRMKKYIKLQERNQFLSFLAQREIYPDTEQAKIFLESDVDIIPTDYYSDEGSVNPIDNMGQYQKVEQAIKDYTSAQETEQEKTDSENEMRAEEMGDEFGDLDNININNVTNADVEKAAEIKTNDKKIDTFYKNDPNTKKIVKREYDKYLIKQKLSKEEKMSPDQFEQSGDGFKIIKSRYEAFQIYDKLTPEQLENKDFDKWLDSEINTNDLVLDIVKENNIERNQIVLTSKMAPNRAKGGTRVDYEEALNLELIGRKTIEPTSGIDAQYFQIFRDKKNIAGQIQGKIIDPSTQTQVTIKERYQGPNAVVEARIAFKAVTAYINAEMREMETINFDGETFSYGQIIKDRNGNNWEIISTQKGVEDYNRLLVVPADKRYQPDMMSYSAKLKPGQLEKDEWVIPEFGNTFNSLPNETPIRKLRITEPVQLYPWVGAKVEEGMPLFEEGQKSSIRTSEQGITSLQDKLKNLTPDVQKGLKFVIKKNAVITPEKLEDWDDKSGNDVNPYLKKGMSKFDVTLTTAGGMPIAKLGGSTAVKLLDTDNKTPIEPLTITDAQAKRLFYTTTKKSGKIVPIKDAAKKIRENYAKAVKLEEVFQKALDAEGLDFVELSVKDLLDVEVNVTKGQLTYNNPEIKKGFIKFSDLDYNTVDDQRTNYLIFDYKTTYDVKGRPKKSIVDVIHNFKTSEERKRWSKLAQDQINNETGFNFTTKVGRYVAAVRFPNDTWTFIELKGAKQNAKEVEKNIVELLDRQKQTVEENSNKKSKKFETYNMKFNSDFSEKFFISGIPGDRTYLGLSNEGLIRLASANAMKKTAFEIFIEPAEMAKHIENNPQVTPTEAFIGLVNFKFQAIEAKRKARSENVRKVFVPIEFKLTKDSFRNHIPDNPTIEDFMDVEAGALPEVRSNVRVNIDYTNQDEIDFIISEANKAVKTPVKEMPKTEDLGKGKELTPAVYQDIFDSKYEDVNEEYLVNIAYKLAKGIELKPNEADLFDAFKDRVLEIKVNRFSEVTTIQAAEKVGDPENLIEQYRTLRSEYEQKRAEWLSSTKSMLLGEYENDLGRANAELYRRLDTNQELNNLKKQLNDLKKRINGNAAFKITKDFDGRDVAAWDSYFDWAKTRLPDFITIEDIRDLRSNAVNYGYTLGAFAMNLKNLRGGKEIKGTIYVGPSSRHAYHESGHAVFRMLLTEPKIKNLLSASRREVRSKMRSAQGYEIDKGVFVKSIPEGLEYLRKLSGVYANMDDKTLTDRLYEEYIMDDFQNFIENPKQYKGPQGIKGFFQKILDWLYSIFGTYTQSDLNRFYEEIDSGKFRSVERQNNRFTNDLQYGISTVALKPIPLSEQDVSIPVEVNGRMVSQDRIVYTYLPAYKAQQAVGTIVNIYLKRLRSLIEEQKVLSRDGAETVPVNKNDVLNDAVNSFIAMHDPNRSFYELEQNGIPYEEIVDDLRARHNAFIEYRTDLVDAANDHLELFDAKLNLEESNFVDVLEQDLDGDQLTTDDWNATAQERGGWWFLPKDVRVLIGTSHLESMDEFGNIVLDDSVDEDMQELVYTTPDVSNVYNGMLKATAGLGSEREILQSLYSFSLRNRDTRAVVKNLFSIVGLDYYRDGEALLDPTSTLPAITNGGYFLSIIKAFDQSRLDYMIMQKNTNTGNVEMFLANHADDAADQQDKWNNHYSTLIKPDNFLKDLESAQDVLDDVIDEMKKKTSNNLGELVNGLSSRIFDTIGIKLHPTYIEYSIASALADRTADQETLLSVYKDIDPITIEGIKYLRKSLSDGDNIFLNISTEVGLDQNEDKEVTKTIIDNNAGIRFRIARWARNNAPFDETVGTTTMLDTDGNRIYSHQMNSYNITKINELNNRDKYYDLFNDKFLENNFLLNDDKTKTLMENKEFRLIRILGTNEKNMELNDQGDLVASSNRDDNRGKGKQIKALTATDFGAALINMYLANVNTKTGEVKEYITPEGESFTTAPINFRLAGDSNLIDLVALPVNKTVELNESGDVVPTEFTVETIKGRILQEMADVHAEIHQLQGYVEDVVVGYNDTPQGRGFNITQNREYLISRVQNITTERRINAPRMTSVDLNALVNESKKIILRDYNQIKSINLKSNQEALTTLKTKDKESTFLIKNKGPINITDAGIDFDTIVENLGSDLVSKTPSKNLKISFKRGDQTYYTKYQKVRKFLLGEISQYVFEFSKVQENVDAESGVEANEVVESPGATSVSTTLLDDIQTELQDPNTDVDDLFADFEDRIGESIINALELQFVKFNKRVNDLGITSQLSRSLAKKIYVNGTENKGAVDKSMRLLNLKQDNLEYNLKQIFFNGILNTKGFNDYLLGNQSLSLPNNAKTKRAKAGQAAGTNAYATILDPELGINHATDKISLLTIEDPKYITRLGGEGDKADAQSYGTVKTFRHLFYGLGKMNNKIQANLLDKIERNEPITQEEYFGNPRIGEIGYKEMKAYLNSKKIVFFDGKTYIKTSLFILSAPLTSMRLNTGEVVAIPGMEPLHNLRVKAERWEQGTEGLFKEEGVPRERITLIVPKTASKMYKSRVMTELEAIRDPFVSEFTADNFIDIDAQHLRLQQINPAGKQVIVDPRQIKSLITSEQNPKTRVWSVKENQYVSVGDIIKDYRKNTSERVSMKYNNVKDLIFTPQGVREQVETSINRQAYTVELYTFLKYAQEALKSSGSSSQMLDLFDVDEFGQPKYELNNVLTSERFQQFVLSFFNKGVIAEKQPGHSIANVSDFGVKKLKRVMQVDENGNPIQWEVVRFDQQKEWAAEGREITIARRDYDDVENDKFVGLKPGDYYLDRLRHDKIKWVKENGKWIDSGIRTSEMMLPAHFREFMAHIKPGDPIPEFLQQLFAIRIPSQDKHSALNAELVDFLPVFYSSSGMFAQELIDITGWDFDIDKVYAQIKEWYYNRATKNFVEYGTRTGKEGFYDYIRYQIRESMIKGSPMHMAMEKAIEYNNVIRNERELIASSEELEEAWDDMTSSVQWSFGLQREINRREYFGDKFDEVVSKRAFAAEWGYRYNEQTNRFDDLYEPLYLGREWMTDEEIQRFLDNKFSNVFIRGLQSLNKPVTETDYNNYLEQSGGVEPYVGAMNNEILDNKMALLGNKHMTQINSGRAEAIAYEPAVADPIEGVWNYIQNNPKTKSLAEAAQEDVDPDSLDGKIQVWQTQKEANIGVVVLSNIVYNTLQEYGKDLQTSWVGGDLAVPRFNNKDYTTFADTYIVDSKTNTVVEATADRKQYVLSALISTMVDNLNLGGLAGKLGLNRDASGIVATLTALSVEPKVGVLLVNHPVVKSVYQRKFNEGVRASIPKMIGIRELELRSWINNLDAKEIQDAEIEMPAVDQAVKDVNVNIELLEDQIQLGYIDSESKMTRKQMLQELATLRQFSIAREIKEEIGTMTRMASLLAGVGRNMDEVDRKQEASDQLGLTLNDTEWLEGYKDRMGQVNPRRIDVRNIYNGENSIQGAYFRIFQDIENNVAPELFITETPAFKNITDIGLLNMGYVDALQKTQLKKDILSYLNARAYKVQLQKLNVGQVSTLNSSLIYDEVPGPKINEILENLRNNADENNYFLKNFIYNKDSNNPQNNAGINLVISNTWGSLDDNRLNQVHNAIWDLYGNPETRMQLLDLIHYLIVKDGLQFKMGTYLHVIPPTLFNNVLASMTGVHSLFKSGNLTDEAMKNLFNGTLNDVVNDFYEGYLGSYKNWYLLPKVYGLDVQSVGETLVLDEQFDPEKMRENESNNIYITADYKGSRLESYRETKGLTNLFGIPIKLAKDKYFTDKFLDKNKKTIDDAIKTIQSKANNRNVVFQKSKDGTIYTGKDIERIYKSAPQTFKYLRTAIERAFGFNITSGRTLVRQPKGDGLKYIAPTENSAGRLIMDIEGGILPFNTRDNENKSFRRLMLKPKGTKFKQASEKKKANLRQIFTKQNRFVFPYIKQALDAASGTQQIITTRAPLYLRHDIENPMGVTRKFFKLKKIHTTADFADSKYLLDMDQLMSLASVTRAEWEEVQGSLVGSSGVFATDLFGGRPANSVLRDKVKLKKKEFDNIDIDKDDFDEDAILSAFSKREKDKNKKVKQVTANNDGIQDVEYEEVANEFQGVNLDNDKGTLLIDPKTELTEMTGKYPEISNWFGTISETSRINVISDLNIADSLEALIDKYKEMQKAFPILTEQGFVEELNKKCKTK